MGGPKPAAGEQIFCPPTLPYVTFSALSEEEMGPIPPFLQARTANLPESVPLCHTLQQSQRPTQMTLNL